MPPIDKFDLTKGITEPVEESKKAEILVQMRADYADAEKRTRALLDEVSTEERKHLEAQMW